MSRVALVSFRSDLFAALHAGSRLGGHEPVLYISGRSARPKGDSYPNMGEKVDNILEGIPPEVDLLLPGDVDGLANALRGYRIDVAVVFGLSWKLPPAVLDVPRLGIVNVHPSALPKYRGPASVQWAIRNGDTHLGVTVHRMDNKIDTGNIIAQHDGIHLPEFITYDQLWDQITPSVEITLGKALDLVADGFPGMPQDEKAATRAPLMEPDFSYIDWSQPAHVIHNQVRTFYYGAGIPGPFAEIDGSWMRIIRTRLEPGDGTRVECSDRPIWIVEAEAAQPPTDCS